MKLLPGPPSVEVESERTPFTFESPAPRSEVKEDPPRVRFVVLTFGKVDVAVVEVAVKYGATTALFEERLLTASVVALRVPFTVRSPLTVVVARFDEPETESDESDAVPLEMVTFVSVAPSLFTSPVPPEVLPPLL